VTEQRQGFNVKQAFIFILERFGLHNLLPLK